MLFRIIKKVINIPYYFNFICFILNESYSKFENDYSRFLKFVFINLFYEGLLKYIIYCIESTFFLIHVQIQAINIVLRFIFIKCFVNSIYFIWDCYNEEYKNILFEFIYMFIYSYILFFKIPIIKFYYICKNYWNYITSPRFCCEFNINSQHSLIISNKIFKTYSINESEYELFKRNFEFFPKPSIDLYYPMFFRVSFDRELRAFPIQTLINIDLVYSKRKEEPEIIEMNEEEYNNYKETIKKITAPDLQIYYPMRFALSSVMIRLTGVILSIAFLLIMFLNFTNLFILFDFNFGELRNSIVYRLTEFYVPYQSFYNTYFDIRFSYEDAFKDDLIASEEVQKHNILTFSSRIKYWLILILFVIKNAVFNLTVNFYYLSNYFDFINNRQFYFNFFYNFLSLIFIYILPIHIYYVFNHSYNFVSNVRYLIAKVWIIFIKLIIFILRLIYIIIVILFYIFKYFKNVKDEPIDISSVSKVRNFFNKLDLKILSLIANLKEKEKEFLKKEENNSNKV